ncbi:hypothetical protein E3N88_31613 [Mikania micrantha]|uniref:Uncharacterized protein n=1 Tax=Mikania micrantha TaxID=192012 RepID=A0A5N6M669_9ASTR|nr:hypothetical protein E3N88_31613 [Mikania micrantha]
MWALQTPNCGTLNVGHPKDELSPDFCIHSQLLYLQVSSRSIVGTQLINAIVFPTSFATGYLRGSRRMSLRCLRRRLGLRGWKVRSNVAVDVVIGCRPSGTEENRM